MTKKSNLIGGRSMIQDNLLIIW